MLRIKGYLGPLVLQCFRRFWPADVRRECAITTNIMRITVAGMMVKRGRTAFGSERGTTNTAS